MGILSFIKKNKKQDTQELLCNIAERIENEENDVIKTKKDILKRLEYLEEYIKSFYTLFPDEYDRFSKIIRTQKEEYNKELTEYTYALENNELTFSIDPEYEVKKLMAVTNLEHEINGFVEKEVVYKHYETILKEFVQKINLLYKVVREDKNVTQEKIISQADNAIKKIEIIVLEVKEKSFFESDNRKKNNILEYIVYSNYIVFKLYLRGKKATNFYDFRDKVTIDDIFIDFDKNVTKFILQELVSIEDFLSSSALKSDSFLNLTLKDAGNLKNMFLKNGVELVRDDDFFKNMLRLENTVLEVARINGIAFELFLPENLKKEELNSIEDLIFPLKDYTISLLQRMILARDYSALFFKEILSSCKKITYVELYLVAKIFNLDRKLVELSKDEYSNISEHFAEIEKVFQNYSDEIIENKKKKVFKSKRVFSYIYLLDVTNYDLELIKETLCNLKIDYKIHEDKLYINSIYFEGLKNII